MVNVGVVGREGGGGGGGGGGTNKNSSGISVWNNQMRWGLAEIVPFEIRLFLNLCPPINNNAECVIAFLFRQNPITVLRAHEIILKQCVTIWIFRFIKKPIMFYIFDFIVGQDFSVDAVRSDRSDRSDFEWRTGL